MMGTSQPTPREHLAHYAQTEAVYAFIRDYVWQEGFSPSLRDIAQGCRLGRTTVLYHLHRLLQWGLIRRAPGKARSIILVDDERKTRREAQPVATADPGLAKLAEWQPLLEGQE